MIRIPHQVVPASLVWTEDLCPEGRALRSECLQIDCPAEGERLRRLAKQARALLSGGGSADCASVLICLSDLYRESDDPDAALACSEQAEQYLSYCRIDGHLHNRAVALYAQGVAHHFLGSKHAAERYGRALTEFRKARDRWVRTCHDHRRRQCDMAAQWMVKLLERLGERNSTSDPSESMVDVPVLSRIAAGKPILTGEDYESWVTVKPADARRANYALEVVGDSMIEAGIRNGSRVLIRQCSAEPANGEIVAVLVEGKAGEEATLKRFYREPDHVRLEPANASHPYLILVETPALVGKVRRQYRQQHPEREPDIRSAQRAQIVGWYVGTV